MRNSGPYSCRGLVKVKYIFGLVRHELLQNILFCCFGSRNVYAIIYKKVFFSANKQHLVSSFNHTVKNIRISTDILWRVFHILTEAVSYTFVSVTNVHVCKFKLCSDVAKYFKIFYYSLLPSACIYMIAGEMNNISVAKFQSNTQLEQDGCKSVSYTHLTLPTILRV